MIRSTRAVLWASSVVAWVFVTLVGSGTSTAAVFENLYTVTVPLTFEVPEDEELPTEEDYVRFAMGQLLTRVTGRTDAFLEPALEDLVRDASQFVVQRAYPDRENLLVTFDGRAVEDALVQRNQPVWGEERPLTLLWVAVDAGFGERSVLASEPPVTPRSEDLLAIEDLLRERLASIASERGLPITLPLWDLEDMSALDFVDVWGGFTDRVRQASERYAADAVLSGRVRVTERGYEVQWTLLRGRGQYILPGGALRSGLDQLADLYAGEFATIGGALIARVTIVNVESLEDYGRLMSYMEGLSVLSSIDVEAIIGTALTLRLGARGGPIVLERVLALSDVLTRLPTPVDDPTGSDLTFSLTR